MPPTKRRSEAISQDPASDSDAPQTQPARRRRRSTSSSPEASDSSSASSTHSTAHVQTSTLIKKLVRLALSTEYSRAPLRRTDITTKVFKESNTAAGRGFKAVFDGAQQVLKDTFGMQLVELPSREKTTLKDRRNQATQTKASSSSSSKSWILISILPAELKTNPAIAQPARAPSVETEASYTALYTFVLSLIYLNNKTLTEQKLERYLKRVNAETFTPLGSLDKLLQRMIREGYLEKRRDTSSGEEVIEYAPGPRGKVEVGVRGVAGLVRSVYGYGAVPLSKEQGGRREDGEGDGVRGNVVKIEEDELNARVSRSLGIRLDGGKAGRAHQDEADQSEDEPVEEEQAGRDSTPTEAGPSRQRQRQSTRVRR